MEDRYVAEKTSGSFFSCYCSCRGDLSGKRTRRHPDGRGEHVGLSGIGQWWLGGECAAGSPLGLVGGRLWKCSCGRHRQPACGSDFSDGRPYGRGGEWNSSISRSLLRGWRTCHWCLTG